MKPTIQITDTRIADSIPVAPENVEVQIINAVPQTFQVVAEDGTESEVTLNIKQAGQPTTLKDEDATIDNLKSQLAQAQASVDSLTKALADKQATRDSIATAVTSSVAQMKPVEVAPVEEVVL
jgi:peptidoglycan hydrolase CwlO-like protein